MLISSFPYKANTFHHVPPFDQSINRKENKKCLITIIINIFFGTGTYLYLEFDFRKTIGFVYSSVYLTEVKRKHKTFTTVLIHQHKKHLIQLLGLKQKSVCFL